MLCAIGFFAAISTLGTLDGAWGWWLVTVPLSAFLWLQFIRPWIRIESDELVIQNAVGKHRIARASITGASAGQDALYVRQGRKKPGGFVWKTRGASAITRPFWSSRVQRADLVCDELEHWVTGVKPPERQLGERIVVDDADWRDVEWIAGPPVAEREH